MTARIYKPAQNAMQSGKARMNHWVLQFDQESRREIEPLMGWTAARDMNQQLRLTFETKEEAIAYAEKNGLAYRVEEPPTRADGPGKSYSDNFKFNRIGTWTH